MAQIETDDLWVMVRHHGHLEDLRARMRVAMDNRLPIHELASSYHEQIDAVSRASGALSSAMEAGMLADIHLVSDGASYHISLNATEDGVLVKRWSPTDPLPMKGVRGD